MSEPSRRKVYRRDSIPLDQTYYTEEGYLVDHPIVTSVGIFVYHNKDGSERRELRLPEEVFSEKSLATYKGKPVIITHDAGYVDKDNVQEEHIGTILSEGYRDVDDVRAEIIIHNTDAMQAAGLRELSLGYNLTLEETPGEWDGQHYDAIQRDIEVNHLALVNKARAGDQARLNIDGEEYLEGGKIDMANTNRKDGTMSADELTAAIDAFKKRRDDRIAAAADAGDTAAGEGNTDAVQCVKDRRDHRDALGDPSEIGGAMGVIAQQDEDIDTLLGVIDVLKAASAAPAATDAADGDDEGKDEGKEKDAEKPAEGDEGEGEEKDDKPASDESKTDGDCSKKDACKKDEGKQDHADSATDFRELLRVVRVGDRLNMDGLETMSVKDAKKAVLKKLKPTLHMDGKSNAYVNAAFDMAVSEAQEQRKDTNFQRSQMMNKDGDDAKKGTGGAAEARQRMIARRMKMEEEN